MRQNSHVSRNDPLMPVPNNQGRYPEDDKVEMPPNLISLMVSGNEALPDGDVRNTWNRTKSLKLLQFYGDPAETDNEDEQTSRSRNRRLRVANKLGVTRTQLNFAQMTL